MTKRVSQPLSKSSVRLIASVLAIALLAGCAHNKPAIDTSGDGSTGRDGSTGGTGGSR